jgi:GDSL-like lipase/acylhydrolase family protein
LRLPSKRFVLPLISVIIAFFLSFFALESVVRVFKIAPFLVDQYRYTRDPYLPYIPQALSAFSGRSSSDEYDYENRHNSLGFRDIEHAHERNDDVFRILGLGDSFTYGVGAKFEDTYLFQLERMLNSRIGQHRRIEIIKAGIPRYFPEPERLLLEHYGKEFSPDLIVVGFLPNDVIDTYFGLNALIVDTDGYLKTSAGEELGTLGVLIYRHSHLLRLLLQKYINYRISLQFHPHLEEVLKDNGFHESDWRVIESEYTKMVGLAKQLHARMLFVHIPQKGPWSESAYYPSKRLAAWASNNGVSFVDVLPTMAQVSGNKPLYYEKDGHCTPEGYAVIAKSIFKYITENKLIP